jgi:hypothetical protein
LNKYCKTSNFNHFCTELYNQSCEEDNEFSNLRINIEKLDSNLTKYTNNAIFDTSVNEMVTIAISVYLLIYILCYVTLKAEIKQF